jgi:predicted nucleic acid-binding protein
MLVLVDTSVWIDHLRRADAQLVALLQEARVLMHLAVLGELACGRISNRQTLLALWLALPRVVTVSFEEALGLVENRKLWGRGLGWTDIHLLASALVSRTTIWTRDQVLRRAAQELSISLRN